MTDEPEKRKKACYVGVPAIFKLELACKYLVKAFDAQTYLVGSAMLRPDWRDVDIAMIMDDGAFEREFPRASVRNGAWEFDPKWLLNSITISSWLSEQCGLPVDFKIQPQTHANERHKGVRNAIGLRVSRTMDHAE